MLSKQQYLLLGLHIDVVHLRSEGIIVGELRVRPSMRRVTPTYIEQRRRHTYRQEFLAKKKGQCVKPSAIQELPGTPNSAHPPSSSNEKALAEETKAAELDADNTESVPSVEYKKKG